MTTDDPRCPSCGILYVTHPGLIPTCRELLEARQWQEYLLKSNAGLEAERNAAETKLHEYLKYNYGKEDCLGCQERDAEVERLRLELESATILENALYAQCDHNLQRAEAAEVEVLRLREQQGILSNEITLQVKRAEAAEQERDLYKAAIAESCDNMRAEGPYEGMGICPQLQGVTAERDRYREDRNLEKQMRKQAEGQREALIANRDRYRAMVNGATTIVELYSPTSPAQKQWKENWLYQSLKEKP